MTKKVKYAGGTFTKATQKDWDKLIPPKIKNTKLPKNISIGSTFDMYKSLVGKAYYRK